MVNIGYQEQFNNLTGDIELNPSSFGLFMRDIDEAALNLKTAIYNGNINLTADLYKQAEQMAEKKYALVTTNGQISGNQLAGYYLEDGVVKEIDMTDKDPGLYMDHMRMGYWSGTSWKARIANTGEMFLGSALDTNYLYWSGSVLTIKGNLILTNGQTVQQAIDNIDVSWDGLSGKPSVLSLAAVSNPTPSGSGLFISSTHMGYYSGGQWKTYMQSNGNFGLSGSGSNYLTWDGNYLTVRGDIRATSATFPYAGSNTQGGNANDTNYVNGYSSSTVATGGVRANNALSSNNRYVNWLSSGEMASASLPSTGVVIGGQGIIGRKNGVNTFEIQASTGDAFFRGNIYAVNGTFTGNITSSANITGGMISTGSSGGRIQMGSTVSGQDSLSLYCYDTSGRVRIRMTPNSESGMPALAFFNSSEQNVGEIKGDSSGFLLGIGGGITKVLGKLKIPVGSNLYD